MKMRKVLEFGIAKSNRNELTTAEYYQHVMAKLFGSVARIFVFRSFRSNRAEIFLIDSSKKNAQIPVALARKNFVADTARFPGQRLGQLENQIDAEFISIK
jgi:hypothetical protein